MPTLKQMKKAQLVDAGIEFFEDTPNLRQELEDMTAPDLLDLLLDSGVEDPAPEPDPEPRNLSLA